jgi:hypothetical protein
MQKLNATVLSKNIHRYTKEMTLMMKIGGDPEKSQGERTRW